MEDTKEADKLEKMKALITEYGIEVLRGNDEILRLAGVYVSAGVIPEKYSTDAVHIFALKKIGLRVTGW